MSAMPQSVYFATVLHMTNTQGRPVFMHIRRAHLQQEAADLLAFSTAAACVHRAAAVRLALRLFLTYEVREAEFQEAMAYREHRRQTRALHNIPSLVTHDPVTTRVRQLVREHQVMAATLNALLRENPALRAAAARHQQRAELQIADDSSETESDSEDET